MSKSIKRNYLTFRCEDCGVERRRQKSTFNKYPKVCRSCSYIRRGWSGPNSPTWKGGHKNWQAGKNGRDKNGLSWKKQRRLAWERDNYTCQHCGKTRNDTGRNPDCHHIVPYRLCQSHALSNLISLCQVCHKKADAAIPDLWGGKPFGISVGRKKKESCKLCNSRLRKLKNGLCDRCFKAHFCKPLAKLMIIDGYSYARIGQHAGVSKAAVWRWVNR